MPNRDELLAEAKRRGLNVSKNNGLNETQTMPMDHSAQAINDSSIFSQPELFSQKMEDFYRASGIHGANRGFAKIFGFGQHQKDTQESYEKAKQTNPRATEAGNIAAQIASAIPFIMGSTSAIKGLTGGNAASALGRYGQNIAGASLGGAEKGLIETPYGEETRGGNVKEGALEFGLGEAFSPALKYGAKEALRIPKKILQTSAVNTAEAMSKGLAKSVKQSQLNYNEIFKAPGLPKALKYRPSNFSELKELGGKGVSRLADEYEKNPTPQNLNLLWGEIKAADRALTNRSTIGEAAKTNISKVFSKTAKEIEQTLKHAFSFSSKPDLYKNLQKSNKYYMDEIVPFMPFREELAKFSAGKYPAGEVNKLANNSPEFRHLFEKEYPGIGYAHNKNALINAPGAIPVGGELYTKLIDALTRLGK